MSRYPDLAMYNYDAAECMHGALAGHCEICGLRTRIAELERERDELKRQLALANATALDRKAQALAAERECDTLREDAERLSWLLAHFHFYKDRGLGYAKGNFTFLCPSNVPSPKDAIDAARKGIGDA